MKNKVIILIIVCFTLGLLCLYYLYPRKISFESVKEIPKLNENFDMTSFIGFHYVSNENCLVFWLSTFYQRQLQEGLVGYDSIFIQNLSKELNFDKYDYIITYQKQLKELRHSPYLTKTKDGLYFDKQTPLIPTFDTAITNKVYIYRIRKNNKYRAPGP
ncbi:MAG: hypothetical protein LBL74_00320 [Bacteroidales bacterium]|jgi:hypothetical protein|nr:hypothetical protein [Bacteroidales bacterium]